MARVEHQPVTDQQRALLVVVATAREDAVATKALYGVQVWVGEDSYTPTPRAVQASLARMAARKLPLLVRVSRRPSRWKVTEAGRALLEAGA